MTFHDFSRLLQNETKDPVSRAMNLIRSQLTDEKRRHVFLSENTTGAWSTWTGGGDGEEGGNPGLMLAEA